MTYYKHYQYLGKYNDYVMQNTECTLIDVKYLQLYENTNNHMLIFIPNILCIRIYRKKGCL